MDIAVDRLEFENMYYCAWRATTVSNMAPKQHSYFSCGFVSICLLY